MARQKVRNCGSKSQSREAVMGVLENCDSVLGYNESRLGIRNLDVTNVDPAEARNGLGEELPLRLVSRRFCSMARQEMMYVVEGRQKRLKVDSKSPGTSYKAAKEHDRKARKRLRIST